MILKSKNKHFHQYKGPILKKIDINKIAVSNNVSLVNKMHFIGYKDVKKLDTYEYLSQKECI